MHGNETMNCRSHWKHYNDHNFDTSAQEKIIVWGFLVSALVTMTPVNNQFEVRLLGHAQTNRIKPGLIFQLQNILYA
jgi:hypothetical protein